MTFFDYGETDFVPCEMCGGRCVDVHHIDRRGMGGSKEKDYIQNLAGLCRDHHDEAEADTEFNALVLERHLIKVNGYMEAGRKNLRRKNLEKWIL